MKRIINVTSAHNIPSKFVNVIVKYDGGAQQAVTMSREDYDIQKAKEEIFDALEDTSKRLISLTPARITYVLRLIETIEKTAWLKGAEDGFRQGVDSVEPGF